MAQIVINFEAFSAPGLTEAPRKRIKSPQFAFDSPEFARNERICLIKTSCLQGEHKTACHSERTGPRTFFFGSGVVSENLLFSVDFQAIRRQITLRSPSPYAQCFKLHPVCTGNK
jgi:hypothetical protein